MIGENQTEIICFSTAAITILTFLEEKFNLVDSIVELLPGLVMLEEIIGRLNAQSGMSSAWRIPIFLQYCFLVDSNSKYYYSEPQLSIRKLNRLLFGRTAFPPTTHTIPLKSKKISISLSRFDQNWISKVERILRSEVNNSQFNNRWLADRLSISERQLHRRLKELTGLGPNHFFREIKLEIALQLLRSGEYATVAQIAHRVGFECPRYFSKIFRKRYGQNVLDLIKNDSF